MKDNISIANTTIPANTSLSQLSGTFYELNPETSYQIHIHSVSYGKLSLPYQLTANTIELPAPRFVLPLLNYRQLKVQVLPHNEYRFPYRIYLFNDETSELFGIEEVEVRCCHNDIIKSLLVALL